MPVGAARGVVDTQGVVVDGKLRGELRNFLDQTLLRHGGSLPRAAQELDIPENVLEKKVRDLGINGNKDTRGER